MSCAQAESIHCADGIFLSYASAAAKAAPCGLGERLIGTPDLDSQGRLIGFACARAMICGSAVPPGSFEAALMPTGSRAGRLAVLRLVTRGCGKGSKHGTESWPLRGTAVQGASAPHNMVLPHSRLGNLTPTAYSRIVQANVNREATLKIEVVRRYTACRHRRKRNSGVRLCRCRRPRRSALRGRGESHSRAMCPKRGVFWCPWSIG